VEFHVGCALPKREYVLLDILETNLHRTYVDVTSNALVLGETGYSVGWIYGLAYEEPVDWWLKDGHAGAYDGALCGTKR
jgi:hypothetical protein